MIIRNQVILDSLRKDQIEKETELIFDYCNVRIYDSRFSEYRNIKRVVFNDTVEKIEEGAFFNCGINELIFKSKVLKGIENFAFQGNPLQKIIISEDFYIANYAFYNCATSEGNVVFLIDNTQNKKTINQFPNVYMYCENNGNSIALIRNHNSKRIVGDNFAVKVENFWVGNTLSEIDLDLKNGEMFFVMGGSGSGKSTLMKFLFGINRATCFGKNKCGADNIFIRSNGYFKSLSTKELSEYFRGKIFYSSQFMIDESDLTIKEELRRYNTGLNLNISEDMIIGILDEYSLKSKYYNKLGVLSGGERKKLQLVKAEMSILKNMDLDVYIFDEIDSGLDEPNAFRIFLNNLKENLIRKHRKLVIVISHHPREIFIDYDTDQFDYFSNLFDKLIVLAKKDNNSPATIAYCGDSRYAKHFFDLRNSEDYSKIVQRVLSKNDGGDGLAETYIKKWREQ